MPNAAASCLINLCLWKKTTRYFKFYILDFELSRGNLLFELLVADGLAWLAAQQFNIYHSEFKIQNNRSSFHFIAAV